MLKTIHASVRSFRCPEGPHRQHPHSLRREEERRAGDPTRLEGDALNPGDIALVMDGPPWKQEQAAPAVESRNKQRRRRQR